MSHALTLPLHTSFASLDQGLDAYAQVVRIIPVLSVEEEYELARRWQTENNVDAARQLVMSHLRFVMYIANGYRGYGLQQADLIQEGNIGLMKAVQRFNPEIGVRLVSFAVHWIRAEIHEFILRNWRIVKVATTKAQRKLFFKLRGMKKRMGWQNKAEVENVARELGVSTKDVLEMEKRMAMQDTSFDPPVDCDDEENFSPASYLEDTRYEPSRALEEAQWQMQNTDRLYTAFARLDTRSQDILQRRWLNDEKATLQTLADEYQVSAERIRQIENAAIKKMRGYMTEKS